MNILGLIQKKTLSFDYGKTTKGFKNISESSKVQLCGNSLNLNEGSDQMVAEIWR